MTWMILVGVLMAVVAVETSRSLYARGLWWPAYTLVAVFTMFAVNAVGEVWRFFRRRSR